MPAGSMPAPLLIADVPWLLYRAYFGLPKSIVGADGQPVNALLGTVNALLAVLDERPARAVVACVGAEQATYRVGLYPPYHAHREPMPAELRTQWTRAPALLQSLGWTVCDAGELEADDAMLSYARVEAEAGGEALLLTADRDLWQAVDEHVKIAQLAKGRYAGEIGRAQVRERYHGIGPELVTDLIALRGDPSDGLPGAPGIGVKTSGRTAAAVRLARGSAGSRRIRRSARCARGRAPCWASTPSCCVRSSRSPRCSASTWSARPTTAPTSPRGRAPRVSWACGAWPSGCGKRPPSPDAYLQTTTA